MATPNIVPRSDSEGGLGTASKYWASAYIDLIYVGAGKVGRDADNNIDFSTDNTTSFVVNGNSELKLDQSQLYPSTSDGLALGHSSYQWSDLFLASGAVINFDNSNVTLTHSSNRLTLADSDELAFGTGNDLRISHNGTQGMMHHMTGDLFMINYQDDGDISFQSDDGSGGITEYFRLDGGEGHMIASKELNFADGVPVTFGDKAGGDLEIKESGGSSYVMNYTGDLQIINNQDDGDIIFKSDDGSGGTTTYLTLDGSAELNRFTKNVMYNDSVVSYFGGGFDLQIYHDGSNSTIQQAGTGNLFIRNITDDNDIIFQNDDGAGGFATYFYLDGSSATHDGSATTNLFTNWPDKSTISLGTSHDFRIQHNGSNTELTNSEGNLVFIQHKDDGDIIFQCDDGSNGVTAYLTLDGSNARTNVHKNLRFDDNIGAVFGSGAALKLHSDGSNGLIDNFQGSLIIRQQVDDEDIIFQCDDGSGGVETYFYLDGSSLGSQPLTRFPDNAIAGFGDSADLRLYHQSGTSYISNENGGNLIIQNSVDDADIIFKSDDGSGGVQTYFFLDGSANTGNLPVTVFPDNSLLWIGTDGGGMRFHADGSNSEFQNHVGNLTIVNNTDDGDIIFKSDNGSGGTATYFFLDGSATQTTFQYNTRHNDSVEARFGNSNDLRIYHDGTNSYIQQSGTGDLYIQNGVNDKDVILRSDDGSGGQTAYITLDGGDVSTIVNTIKVLMPNLPTSDPSVAGQLWNDSGTLKISAG
jgi:hypothetical protein